MASPNIARRINNWHVIEEESHSDHFYIEYKVEGAKTQKPLRECARRNLRSIDPKTLEKAIDKYITEMNTNALSNDSAETLDIALREILDEVAPKRPVTTKRKSVHWWNPQIQQLRKECNHLRRIYQRIRKRVGIDTSAAEKESMKEAKLKLTKAIKKSKEDAWRELCRLTDPWGRLFKIVMGKLSKKTLTPGINTQSRMESIVQGLFPTHPHKEETNWPLNGNSVIVAEMELKRAASTLKANKAPGPDGVTNEILKKVVELRPEQVLNVFNKCITQASFPVRWKTAKLVLVRKGDKPLEEPSSYRPLCMLNTTGKLLEKILDTKIRDFMETNNSLAANQYGFRSGRSTVGAATRLREIVDVCKQNIRHKVRLLTLDIRNAFNSAP